MQIRRKTPEVKLPRWYWYVLVASVFFAIGAVYAGRMPARSETKTSCATERCAAIELYFAIGKARKAEEEATRRMWMLHSAAHNLRIWAAENLYVLLPFNPPRAAQNSVLATGIEEYAELLDSEAAVWKRRAELLREARERNEKTLYLLFRKHPDLKENLEREPKEVRLTPPTRKGRRFSF